MTENLNEKEVCVLPSDDPTAAERKRDHIELAFKAQINTTDTRFYYEPMMAAHPTQGMMPAIIFLQKKMSTPIWVSSMTGGTAWANIINQNLAKVCRDFGMGMGLGSCRQLLYSNEYLADFDVRQFIGDDLPLYANLGIAQIEQLILQNQLHLLDELVDKLSADGLIIHINPLQEWLQPEGDKIAHPPIATVKRVLDVFHKPLIIKEVGQGFGYQSLKELLQLPLAAIDFAASGGTNFAQLELLRTNPATQEIFAALANVGHTADDMLNITNQLLDEIGNKRQCHNLIISGGISNFLDGYYLTQKSKLPAVYGQASAFLKHARGTYDELYAYTEAQVRGLELANAFLKIRQ